MKQAHDRACLMVPKEGLEPSRLAAHAPETCASTNSATSVSLQTEAGYAPQLKTIFPESGISYPEIEEFVVPGTGLEPAQLAPYAPQTYVSTNFTTRASLVSV